MKNIAICIPSYNEADNIQNITKKIDRGLRGYKKENNVVIVNVDNDSEDKTSEKFLETETMCEKVSIVTKEVGKGVNILAFFNYCKENNIDYMITIDADLKSFESNWIMSFLNPLISGKYDYVTPIYKRSRYEGSTTNHFSYPIIYAISGKKIRQPIAGEFSFNKKFIDAVLSYPINKSVQKYGIDIFMTLIAVCNDLNIHQIFLKKKIHNPSYNKMENMFREVLDAFIFTWININKGKKTQIRKIEERTSYINSMLSSKNFKHKKQAKEMNQAYRKKLENKKNIEVQWIDCLEKIIVAPKSITDTEKEKILNLFMVRATNFWLEAEKISAMECEDRISLQGEKLRRKIEELS